MKPIVVATDFSTSAYNAACYAADMVMSMHGYLILLHVYQVPVSTSEVPVYVDTDTMVKDAEKQLAKLEGELIHRTGGKLIVESEVQVGTVFHKLNEVCKNRNPYAVVMGSQGTTAAERLLFGGHTVYAMRHLKWPVIAVPPNVKFNSIKKIGLACDFREVVETTPVEELKFFIQSFNAELHVLNTGPGGEFDPEEVFQSGLLNEMLESVKPVYHFLTNKDIDEAIIEFADRQDIQLLVVLPRRHSLIDRLMHKSHTKQMVLHSHVPVMALHV